MSCSYRWYHRWGWYISMFLNLFLPLVSYSYCGWLLELFPTLLFMIVLFSLPIRFQVFTLPPEASLVDTSLMILRHLRDVTRRTIFVGGIVWIEILQSTGNAPILSISKAETLFPLLFCCKCLFMTFPLYLQYSPFCC